MDYVLFDRTTVSSNFDGYHVYALLDPTDRAPKYVGFTSDPRSRHIQHANPNERAGGKLKSAWITSLKENGLTPLMTILSKAESLDEAKKQESHYIWTFTIQGVKLFNREVQAYWLAKEALEQN